MTDHMPTPPMEDSNSATNSRVQAYADSEASREACSARRWASMADSGMMRGPQYAGDIADCRHPIGCISVTTENHRHRNAGRYAGLEPATSGLIALPGA